LKHFSFAKEVEGVVHPSPLPPSHSGRAACPRLRHWEGFFSVEEGAKPATELLYPPSLREGGSGGMGWQNSRPVSGTPTS